MGKENGAEGEGVYIGRERIVPAAACVCAVSLGRYNGDMIGWKHVIFRHVTGKWDWRAA